MFLINGGYQPPSSTSSASLSSSQQQAIEPVNIIFDNDVIPSVNTQTNEILPAVPPSKRSRTSNVSSTSSVRPQVGFPVVSIHGDQPASGLAFFLISASALYRNPDTTVSANRFLNEFPHIVYSVAIPSKKEKQKDIGKKFVFANKFGNIALTAHHLGGSGGSVPKPQATRKSTRKKKRKRGGTREMFIDLRRDEIILCNKIFSQICLFNVDFSVVKIYNSYLKYLYDRDFKITWKKMAFARGRDGVWQKLFRKVEDPKILSSFINKLNQGTYINSGEYYEKLNIIKNSVGEDDLDEYFYDAYYYVKLLNSLPIDNDMYFNNDNYSLKKILRFRSTQLPQIYNKLGARSSPARKAYSFVRQYVSNKKKSTKCRDIQPTQPTQSRQSRQQRQRERKRDQPSTPNRPTQPPRASNSTVWYSPDSSTRNNARSTRSSARNNKNDDNITPVIRRQSDRIGLLLRPAPGGGYISYKKNKRKTRRRRKKRKKKKTRRKNKRRKKTKRRRKKKKKTRRRR